MHLDPRSVKCQAHSAQPGWEEDDEHRENHIANAEVPLKDVRLELCTRHKQWWLCLVVQFSVAEPDYIWRTKSDFYLNKSDFK
jgi:hypothetical protein